MDFPRPSLRRCAACSSTASTTASIEGVPYKPRPPGVASEKRLRSFGVRLFGAILGAVIEAEGLAKRYGEVIAAESVTFSVGPGEVVGLLGPNGAGKTTILRMIAGILTPTAGTARV